MKNCKICGRTMFPFETWVKTWFIMVKDAVKGNTEIPPLNYYLENHDECRECQLKGVADNLRG